MFQLIVNMKFMWHTILPIRPIKNLSSLLVLVKKISILACWKHEVIKLSRDAKNYVTYKFMLDGSSNTENNVAVCRYMVKCEKDKFGQSEKLFKGLLY